MPQCFIERIIHTKFGVYTINIYWETQENALTDIHEHDTPVSRFLNASNRKTWRKTRCRYFARLPKFPHTSYLAELKMKKKITSRVWNVNQGSELFNIFCVAIANIRFVLTSSGLYFFPDDILKLNFNIKKFFTLRNITKYDE